MLPVFTTEGVEGLKRKFIEAEDRPPSGYVAGLCLLAAGPGIADMTVIYDLFSSPDARQAALDSMTAAWDKTKEEAEQEWKDKGVENAWNDAESTAEQAVSDLEKAGRSMMDVSAGDFTGIGGAIADIAKGGPVKDIENLAADVEGEVGDAVKRARGWTEQSKKRAPRSLVTGHAATRPKKGRGKP
jgi:hypothetical protein